MRRLGTVILAVLSAGVTAASAASLYPEAGAVHVNFGNGYRPVGAPTVLLPGSKILVASEAKALLVYSTTCRVRLGSGVWDVLAKQPCGAESETLDFAVRMNQGAPDVGNAEDFPGVGTDGAPAAEGGIGTTTLVVGGLIAGGAVAAAIALSQGGGSDKPASP
ncbi:hypothetical protein [Hyphomicrobium sulfonivorans]|uniref:hypothetical protein n=1 Tax=Hyphomicrobium sulfonivorans TaxID=121290 RepID=UPI001A2D1D2A|nr:hypothetical protein [Hyphomicrobium sulfonivorans]MBI1650991.1 hypothetical protein [Hyphomicrobium sulfonivorans]NSL72625.1 hypothetical protein [Hyphomicrobium sulfonivorans]